MPFRRRRLQDHDLDGVAGLKLGGPIDTEGEHLALRDHGFGLGPDIDDQAIGRRAHDHPLDDFAAAKLTRLRILHFEERPHVHLFDCGGFWLGGIC